MGLQAKPLQLSTADAGFEAAFAARLHWSADTDAAIEQRVADILADVQQRGDAAVLAYTQRFDGLQATDVSALEITQAELQAALDSLPAAQRDALIAAAARVRTYHEAQKKRLARAGLIATKTAPCSVKRSHHWTAWASTCPAARRLIPHRS
jgi:histidinol dehydrogenase